MKIFKYFLQFTIVLSLFLTFKIIGLQNASFVGSCLAKIFGPLFRSKKIIEKEEPLFEVGIEINDSTTAHNRNHAIHLKSKTEDTKRLLEMAEAFLDRHKIPSVDIKPTI
mgnify:CR=1 FL=1